MNAETRQEAERLLRSIFRAAAVLLQRAGLEGESRKLMVALIDLSQRGGCALRSIDQVETSARMAWAVALSPYDAPVSRAVEAVALARAALFASILRSEPPLSFLGRVESQLVEMGGAKMVS